MVTWNDDRRHLEPGWRAPWANRPRGQKWAAWVREWKPESGQGKAAKAYVLSHSGDCTKRMRLTKIGPVDRNDWLRRMRAKFAEHPEPSAEPGLHRAKRAKAGGEALELRVARAALADAAARIAELEDALAWERRLTMAMAA